MSVKISQFNAGKQLKYPGGSYNYFLPSLINTSFDIDVPVLQTQLEKAAMRLGELNSMAKLVPDLDLFLHNFIGNEANASSRIEGTQTNIEDVFKEAGNISAEKKDDWRETILYIKALQEAIRNLQDLPLCNRLIQQAHRTLLSSGRGKNKLPGEFRRSQNWIGGSSIQTAAFIPPHYQHIGNLMSDLEKFLNNSDNHYMPDLVRIGIAHYQFETIHPFLDGNGRVGRMLIPLFLAQYRLLDKPLLYLSVFFEKHRAVYYDKLSRARAQHGLAGWLLFFLEGVEKVALFSSDTLKDILELRDSLTKTLSSGKRVNNNTRALEFAFKSPIFTAKRLCEKLGVSQATAYNIIKDLSEANIIEKYDPFARRQFVFNRYFDIFKKEFPD